MMTDTKFTPGPWACHFGDDEATCNCKYVLAEYGGMGSIATIDVCEKMDGDWGDDKGPSIEIAKANARLIVAAPDLYAAAERALEYAEDGARPTVGLADMLRAALAKARGQS